jgi:hypothetical protein
MDIQIRFGQANLASGMRVIPAHRLESTRFVAYLRKGMLQTLLVSEGEQERGPERMLALQRLVAGNFDLPIVVSPEQNPSDFQPPVRYQEIGIYHRNANLFENRPRIENLERRSRWPPRL